MAYSAPYCGLSLLAGSCLGLVLLHEALVEDLAQRVHDTCFLVRLF